MRHGRFIVSVKTSIPPSNIESDVRPSMLRGSDKHEQLVTTLPRQGIAPVTRKAGPPLGQEWRLAWRSQASPKMRVQ